MHLLTVACSSVYSPPPSPSGTLTITSGHAQYQSVPVYEMKFPDLCVYWVAHEDLSIGSKAYKWRPRWVFRVYLMCVNMLPGNNGETSLQPNLGTYRIRNGGAVYGWESFWGSASVTIVSFELPVGFQSWTCIGLPSFHSSTVYFKLFTNR